MGIDELYGFIIIGVAIVVGRWIRDAAREAARQEADSLRTRPPTPAGAPAPPVGERARLDREADAYVDGLVVGAVFDPLGLHRDGGDAGRIGATPHDHHHDLAHTDGDVDDLDDAHGDGHH